MRTQLDIARWIVFGGSWGASLAIAYAASIPSSCLGVVLRGTFLTGSRDLDWFFGGAGSLLPAAWQKLVRSARAAAGRWTNASTPATPCWRC